MSEDMHTAGPWALDETGWICDANGSPVCLINAGDLEPQERADARLIAAAPDLLEALKWFAERSVPIQSKFDHHGPADMASELRRVGITQAINAIAKAEGK